MSRYVIPRPFKGEERYFYFFTRKSLVYTIIGSSIGLGIAKIFELFGYMITGVVIAVIITLPFYVMGSYKVSKDNPYNGGEDYDKGLIRRIRKKYMYSVYVHKDGE